MSLLQRACKTLGGLGLVVTLPTVVFGQSTNSTNHYAPQGGEYAPAGITLGDQARPSLSVGLTGGYLVWQDNATDGDGLGISAVQLDNQFSPRFSNFRVNQVGTADQENPQVALMLGGGAAFVWQSGKQSFQHIMARFLSSSNIWLTGDVQVNTATNHYQLNPQVAALPNGNIAVVWASYGQDNADGLQGVYGQIMSPAGQKVGSSEFQVNQFTPNNQRTPAIAVFPDGRFIVVWVSERQRASDAPPDGLGNVGGANNFVSSTFASSVSIYARIFNADGTTTNSEFPVDLAGGICANPSVAVASDGSFIISWSQNDLTNPNNGWDVVARPFSSSGVGGTVAVVNSLRYGDQYGPKISSLNNDYLVVWTSLAQDGSRQGIFGQFLHGDGSRLGGEMQVNTTVLNQQVFPAVASDKSERFLAVWSSYNGVTNGLDLEAQRYATTLQPLSAPSAPYVLALDSFHLSVSWPQLAGFNVSYYDIYVDGSTTPVQVTNDLWSNPSLFLPSTTHTFQLAYTLADGRISPLSSTASGTTWGIDNNGDGLPDDWETMYYGSNSKKWPGAQTQLAPGVTLFDVFLWGANPTNSSTWLKQTITSTKQGLFLNWNTVPGGFYQVLTSTDLQNWTPVGGPRLAAGTTDSIFLGMSSQGYYQIVRNRF